MKVDTTPLSTRHVCVGRRVRVMYYGREIARGTISHVVQSRFGLLAHLDNNPKKAYRVLHCEDEVRFADECVSGDVSDG